MLCRHVLPRTTLTRRAVSACESQPNRHRGRVNLKNSNAENQKKFQQLETPECTRQHRGSVRTALRHQRVRSTAKRPPERPSVPSVAYPPSKDLRMHEAYRPSGIQQCGVGNLGGSSKKSAQPEFSRHV